MSDVPLYGQKAPHFRRELCPKHPQVPAVAYCKRCNRPACYQCAIQNEVGATCVDCAEPRMGRFGRVTQSKMFSAAGSSPWSRGTVPINAQSRLKTWWSSTPVTVTLIFLNTLLWVMPSLWSPLFQHLAFNPIVGRWEPWRMLTTTFLHGGFFHLLFNMLILAILGGSMEKVFGWWRYLSIYLLSAFGGSIAVVAWTLVQPETLMVTTVGASGAIYGLLGAILVAQRRAGMSSTSIIVLLAVNVIYGFTVPGISWQAHIGGFVAGLFVASIYLLVFDAIRSKGSRHQTMWGLLVMAVLFFSLGAAAFGLYSVVL